MANMLARALKREIRESFAVAATKAQEEFERQEGTYKQAKSFRPGDFIRDRFPQRGAKFRTVAKVIPCTTQAHARHLEIQNGPTWCVNDEDWFNTK